jgi:hypothetical protein
VRKRTTLAIIVVAGTALGAALLLIVRPNHPKSSPVAAQRPIAPVSANPPQTSSGAISTDAASTPGRPPDASGVVSGPASQPAQPAVGTFRPPPPSANAAATPRSQPAVGAATGGTGQPSLKNSAARPAGNPSQSQMPAQPGIASAEPVIPLPIARSALGFVGNDPEAEAVWFQAINDPNLAANARKDLIEDLNEDGFPDHKNLTIDDLPLIQSRIDLIEELAEDAMDDVNAAAFAEAYKDLVNMRQKVTGM